MLKAITLGSTPLLVNERPRLIVFGFDADQRDGEKWKPHREKLEDKLVGQVRFVGDAKNIRLDW